MLGFKAYQVPKIYMEISMIDSVKPLKSLLSSFHELSNLSNIYKLCNSFLTHKGFKVCKLVKKLLFFASLWNSLS